MSRNRFAALLILLVFGLIFARAVPGASDQPNRRNAGETPFFGFAEAVDGDTLRLSGTRLRLKGLDAPEYAQTCERDGGAVPCGRESAAALRRLLAKAPVACLSAENDRYGRPLVVCRQAGVDIGAELVRSGMAVSFYGGYRREEAEARAGRVGLWSGYFEQPADWRRRSRERGAHPI